MKKENLKKMTKKDLIVIVNTLSYLVDQKDSLISHLQGKINIADREMNAKHRTIEQATVTIQDLRSQKNSEIEHFDRNYREEKQSMETEAMVLKNKLISIDTDLEETKEALSRSRQLCGTYKEFSERNRDEKPSIEKMAKNLHAFCMKEIYDTIEKSPILKRILSSREYLISYEDSQEDTRDIYRANVTHIISHNE